MTDIEKQQAQKQEMAYHFSTFTMYIMAATMRISQVFEPILFSERLVIAAIVFLDIICLVFAFFGEKKLEQVILKTVTLTSLAEFLLFATLHFETVTSTGIAMRLILPCMFLYRLCSLDWIGRKTI